MKTISNRTIRRYIGPIVQWARDHHTTDVDMDDPVFTGLLGRVDAYEVFKLIETLHYADIVWDDDAPVIVRLTDTGYACLETSRNERWLFWRNSVFVPILVTVLTTVIATQLLPTAISALQGAPETPAPSMPEPTPAVSEPPASAQSPTAFPSETHPQPTMPAATATARA